MTLFGLLPGRREDGEDVFVGIGLRFRGFVKNWRLEQPINRFMDEEILNFKLIQWLNIILYTCV